MIVSMYCPNGRVGKTTTALALAHAAQSDFSIDTCVLEFDFSPGDVASILNLDPAKNILDAAEEHYDIAIQRPQGEEFDVIIAGYPDYPEQLKSEDIIRIINELEARYRLVIIDIQPSFIEQVIDILTRCTKIVLVLNNEAQSVTRVLNNIAWGVKSGFMDESKFEILINKFNKRDKINYIVESQLQYPLLTTIPQISDFKGYSDERFSRHMGKLVNMFFPNAPDNKEKSKGGFFSSLFGKKKSNTNQNDIKLIGLPAPASEIKLLNSSFGSTQKNNYMEEDMLDLTSDMIDKRHEILNFSKELASNDKEAKLILANSNNIKKEVRKDNDTDGQMIEIVDTNGQNEIINVLGEDIFKLAETNVSNENNLANEKKVADEILAQEQKVANDKRIIEEEIFAQEQNLANDIKIEEQRIADEKSVASAKKADEEKRVIEEQKIAQEQKLTNAIKIEEQRIADEKSLASAKKADEEKKVIEEQRIAQDQKLANDIKIEEQRVTDEKRVAEVKKADEEKRVIEEQRIAQDQKLANDIKIEEQRIADAKKVDDENRIFEEKKNAKIANLNILSKEKNDNIVKALTEENNNVNIQINILIKELSDIKNKNELLNNTLSNIKSELQSKNNNINSLNEQLISKDSFYKLKLDMMKKKANEILSMI